jgi:hypothetical protein
LGTATGTDGVPAGTGALGAGSFGGAGAGGSFGAVGRGVGGGAGAFTGIGGGGAFSGGGGGSGGGSGTEGVFSGTGIGGSGVEGVVSVSAAAVGGLSRETEAGGSAPVTPGRPAPEAWIGTARSPTSVAAHASLILVCRGAPKTNS